WRNAIGGFLIHLALGGIYLWGNITNSVTSHLRYYQPHITYDDTDIVYGTALGVIGVATVIGGLLEKHIGSPKVALLGGSVISFSCFLSAIANSLLALLLTQGVMFGLGFGIAFAAPVSCAIRWCPSQKGLLTGMITSGLGSGAFLFGFASNAIVNPNAIAVEDSGEHDGYFLPDGEVSNRVPLMFMFMGFFYLVLVFVGALDIDQSSSGNSAHGMDESNHSVGDSVGAVVTQSDEFKSHIGLDKLYKDPMAWHVSLCFTLTAATGMYVAGTFKTFGQSFIGNESYLIAIASASSLFNMAGRLLWGLLGDKYGPVNVLMVLSFLFSFLLAFYSFTAELGLYAYAAWTCLIFLFEGGNFTLYMSIIVYLFGPKRAATNYGSIFFVFSV
ncbi:unnamed protein product, partial [Ectocarpus fasciculatus]